jgi:mRNA interferase MazF
MFFTQGEIVEFDFSPAFGSESQSKRPALVVSSNEFNQGTSMTLVCPITTRDSGFPLHIRLPEGLDTYGFVAVEQIRAFDLNARHATPLEHLGETSDFMRNIRCLIRTFV